jgi:hypothetical protein
MLLHKRRQLRHCMPVFLVGTGELQPHLAQRFMGYGLARTKQHRQALIACGGRSAHRQLEFPKLRSRTRRKQLHAATGKSVGPQAQGFNVFRDPAEVCHNGAVLVPGNLETATIVCHHCGVQVAENLIVVSAYDLVQRFQISQLLPGLF